MEGYDIAQICLNGHVVNDSGIRYPEDNKDFCIKCGAKTTVQCLSCQKNIQGRNHVEGFIDTRVMPAPNYCHNCGKPYPWTQRAIEAAQEFAELQEELKQDEIDYLKSEMPELFKDSPKTMVVATKTRRLFEKVGPRALEGLKNIAIDFLSETAKKTLFQ